MGDLAKISATAAVERAVSILAAAGFIADGATKLERVRIPTSSAPVFGGAGGELRTTGGRSRFALPNTTVRATVGPRTVCVFRRCDREDVTFLGNFDTRDFTPEDLLGALSKALEGPADG